MGGREEGEASRTAPRRPRWPATIGVLRTTTGILGTSRESIAMDTSHSANEEARQGERQHIFLVNHDPKFLDFGRELLQDARYNVTTTNYVPRTWDQIAALQPDLLVIDVSLPGRAGWALLEQLHAQGVTGRIPIIVTSTDPGQLDLVELDRDRYGGDKVIAKPFHVDALLDAIHAL